MAIIGFSAPPRHPRGGIDVQAGAGIRNPSGEPRQEAELEEPIPHQSTSDAPTSSPIMTPPSPHLPPPLLPHPHPSRLHSPHLPHSEAPHSLPRRHLLTPSSRLPTQLLPPPQLSLASIARFKQLPMQPRLVRWRGRRSGCLKDVCGLLREAADRDKAFQDEIHHLKRAKTKHCCTSRLALEEESIRLPQHQAINATIRQTFDPLEVYNDAAVVQHYRLPREAIRHLLATISQDLRRATGRSFALTPQVQLLAALRFYATGSFLQVVGDGLGLSKSSVCRSVQAVTYSLLSLVPQHVRFPTTRDEMSATQEQFFRSFRIPQVVGAVDGTLVPILTPRVDAHVFICRKGYAAVNCQVVCDHQGIILDVVARWPGSTHDSFVFKSPPSVGWLQPPGESGGSSETVVILFGLTS
ncbi:putative nuclease HARBI1 [Merluccius polli]|uniref:Putative nuclease HARBI1 n=1 Tax=Merluccius polli TaxID=89951 RepID=A0AA47NDD6_MERPO|nr:putative nuclease HARBI1 [Merluccius polli]